MRPELRWAVAAIVAFGLGATFAEPYARLAAPYYAAVDRLIAAGHPWEVSSVDVKPGKSRLSAELQLSAYIRRLREDPDPAIRAVGTVQVGEVVETPILFWTLLLLWPAASVRQRFARLIIGIPLFLGLEAATTATQLVPPMAQASAILAGDTDPVTAWDLWSRFLEAGGQFVLICGGALAVVSWTHRTSVPAPSTPRSP